MVLKPRFDSQAIFRMTWWICDRTLCSAAVPWSAAVNRWCRLSPRPCERNLSGLRLTKGLGGRALGFLKCNLEIGVGGIDEVMRIGNVKRGLQHNHCSVELQASLVFSMFFLSVVVLFCTNNSRWGLSSIDGWRRYLLMAHVFANDHSQDHHHQTKP